MPSSNLSSMNLSDVLQEAFLVLTPKEREVVTKRFALDNRMRLTLEKIGQKFSVTRERIRQIEKVALTKLRRTSPNTRFKMINEIAHELLKQHGGLLEEEALVKQVLRSITSSADIDAHIVKLALHINPDLRRFEKHGLILPFWRLKEVDLELVRLVVDTAYHLLHKKGDVIMPDLLIQQTHAALETKNRKLSLPLVTSTMILDKRAKLTKEGFGLIEWRHINPKSIRDKAFIILKKAGRPMHFVEIANKIMEAGFDNKTVTTQAVHNELIRYDQFVLVGRGLYALKAWGYKSGTVSDIIEHLLRKRSPLSKQEIINGVLKQRFVKKGTISLNLQKDPKFVRVGRAVYTLAA